MPLEGNREQYASSWESTLNYSQLPPEAANGTAGFLFGGIMYVVRDWERIYETHETRKLKYLHWIPVPVKRDGEGYSRLVSGEHGAANLGSWLAILQVAATSGSRGRLCRKDGTAFDAEAISFMSRLPITDIERTLPLLCHPSVNWLFIDENSTSPENIPQSPDESGCGGKKARTNRTEQNRIEHKKRDIYTFVPPTVDEVLAYCKERHNAVSSSAFVDHYESNGWMVGKTKMRNWQAAVRTWEKNNSVNRPVEKRYMGGP